MDSNHELDKILKPHNFIDSTKSLKSSKALKAGTWYKKPYILDRTQSSTFSTASDRRCGPNAERESEFRWRSSSSPEQNPDRNRRASASVLSHRFEPPICSCLYAEPIRPASSV